MKKENISLILVVALILGVFGSIEVYNGFEYTGLQTGKPDLQANSIWITKAAKDDIFENNLFNLRICNSGISDLVSDYKLKLIDVNNPRRFAIVDGKPINIGLCKTFLVKFEDLDLYNKKNINLKLIADNENRIDEMNENDNINYGLFSLVDFAPNLKTKGFDVSGYDFYNMKVNAEVCNIPGNAKVYTKTSINVDFTINGVKRTVVVNESIKSHDCLIVSSPKLAEFAISKNKILNIHVIANPDRLLSERSYNDNTFSSSINLGN